MGKQLSVCALIDKLGGATKLAASLDVSHNTVQAWKTRGIPPKYWREICALAKITPLEVFEINERLWKLNAR